MRRLGVLLVIALVISVVIIALALRPLVPRPLHVSAPGAIGAGWQGYDLIVSPGDWNATAGGAPDIIARKASDGSLWLFAGDGRGGYIGPTQIGSGWNEYTQLVAAYSFRGHDYPNDLMAVRNDGYLILFSNLGHGVFGNPVSLGPGWGGFDAVLGSGDFNGDGIPDVIVRNAGDGSLTLYRGNGRGGFSGHSLITSVSFAEYSLLTAPGDWDNDGYPDLLGRSRDGTLCLFRGDGRGGLQNTSCIAVGSGWGVFDAIAAPGTWDADNSVDLVARTPNGSLWLATGAGISGYADPLSLPQCSPITLYISSYSPSYTINFERFGEANPQSVAILSEINGHVQAIPPNAGRDGANWQPSATYSDTCAWKSGLHAAQLTTTANVGSTGASLNYTAHITFVVRSIAPPPARTLLVVASTNTWAAYNDWPQKASFYDGPPKRRPTQVSYLRPDPGASPVQEGSHLAAGELLVLQWLAANNFAYQMVTDVDINDSPWLLSTANYYAVLLNTHSEYWTDAMYDSLARYLQNGGSVLSLSGNTMYREERLAKPGSGASWSSLLIGGTTGRNGYAVGNLLGLQFYETGDTCASYRVLQPKSWLMAGVTSRTIGSQGKFQPPSCFLNRPGASAGASGDEFDVRLPFLPSRKYQIVATGNNADGGADMVWYVRRDGGQTVNVGSITFGNSLVIDRNLSRIVTNALTQFQKFKDSGQTTFGGLVAPGDWDGDGHPDLLARRGDKMYLFRGNGYGDWLNNRVVSSGWARFDLIAPAGRWTQGARPDLFARRASDGALFVMPNNGHGGFAQAFRLGPTVHWSAYDTITGVGDWNGDDIPDLVARTPGGSLYLYKGTGHGRINPVPMLLATGWDSYDQMIGLVDWNGDGLPDLIARKPDGSMWIVFGRVDHHLSTPQEITRRDSWDNYSTILAGSNWSGSGYQDVMARRPDGRLVLYPGGGETSVHSPIQMGDGWNAFS